MWGLEWGGKGTYRGKIMNCGDPQVHGTSFILLVVYAISVSPVLGPRRGNRFNEGKDLPQGHTVAKGQGQSSWGSWEPRGSHPSWGPHLPLGPGSFSGSQQATGAGFRNWGPGAPQLQPSFAPAATMPR